METGSELASGLETGDRGPPRYRIDQEQLNALLNMRMTVTEMARSGVPGHNVPKHCH